MIHPWNADAWQALLGRLERLPHAILISGPQGIGKFEFSQELAKRLLCESSVPGAQACGICEGCRWFGAQTHPDFRLIEPEALSSQGGAVAQNDDAEEKPDAGTKRGKPSSEIRVEQIRELADFLNIGSHRAGRRIALLHPAERMTQNAANSLLKALEEPPSGAVFILVAHNAAHLLPTIRSRCASVTLRVPASEIAADWLTAQSVANADRWLKFYGGAPLLAREKLVAVRADSLAALFRASAVERRRLYGTLKERDDILRLVDALQKYALDRALVAAGAAPRYLQMKGAGGSRQEIRKWIHIARRLGHYRPIATHPLNSSLLINQIFSEIF